MRAVCCRWCRTAPFAAQRARRPSHEPTGSWSACATTAASSAASSSGRSRPARQDACRRPPLAPQFPHGRTDSLPTKEGRHQGRRRGSPRSGRRRAATARQSAHGGSASDRSRLRGRQAPRGAVRPVSLSQVPGHQACHLRQHRPPSLPPLQAVRHQVPIARAAARGRCASCRRPGGERPAARRRCRWPQALAAGCQEEAERTAGLDCSANRRACHDGTAPPAFAAVSRGRRLRVRARHLAGGGSPQRGRDRARGRAACRRPPARRARGRRRLLVAWCPSAKASFRRGPSARAPTSQRSAPAGLIPANLELFRPARRWDFSAWLVAFDVSWHRQALARQPGRAPPPGSRQAPRRRRQRASRPRSRTWSGPWSGQRWRIVVAPHAQRPQGRGAGNNTARPRSLGERRLPVRARRLAGGGGTRRGRDRASSGGSPVRRPPSGRRTTEPAATPPGRAARRRHDPTAPRPAGSASRNSGRGALRSAPSRVPNREGQRTGAGLHQACSAGEHPQPQAAALGGGQLARSTAAETAGLEAGCKATARISNRGGRVPPWPRETPRGT